ncbi:pyridoxal phosphate-dependent aminotransferase family protein [Polaribacter batillariae]|uniref:Pyridoxal phosphate-dependent aminotransferase family protein n=1 Tax=Polaribacter batillariae TaxID=2808900 RepID=A0ABX7SXT5_9FLAO|nr:pyridoxal phosphate-dependent aminotransferase family protein [Polaribacter batillariae]QTD39062.1 pyridoxal phosphate-dependent aminotransferase family protein [Polaribacter batillariae]
MKFPKKLKTKIDFRTQNNSLRRLKKSSNLVDFSSNDYLGFAKSEEIFNKTHQFLLAKNTQQNGATGSRLLSGNHFLYEHVESFLSTFHQTESAIIFNSGYDANIGFFSSVPQRGDVILYDEFSHASIRDGIRLSNAKSFKFSHNNLEDLEKHILSVRAQSKTKETEIYVVTEAVFSMDGDSPDFIKMTKICEKHDVFLIVDEAHSIGVFGKNGCGLVEELALQKAVFARIVTFGKALGCHGAAILGSKNLQEYLVNFARSFIYTTALSPHSLATIYSAYQKMLQQAKYSQKLNENIAFFKAEVQKLELKNRFINSNSAIHCCVISGNEKVKKISRKFQEKGFDVKAILSPTVPENKERLRFCLHSYNSKEEIRNVLHLLSKFN